MINRNEANYTNFDGKTNKRIVQAPGGSSSISLSWGHENTDSTNTHRQQNQKNNAYGQQNMEAYTQNYGNSVNKGRDSYDEPIGVMGYNHEKGMGSNRNLYEEQNSKPQSYKSISSSNLPIGGEHGYNNYNPINHTGNSYQNYPPTNKYPPQQTRNDNILSYQEKNDQATFYKPSTHLIQNEYDTALEQQKHKIESSRSQRSHNQSTSSNSIYQNFNNNEGKPCVKIHQQKNNDIFGSNYDYWKQDGHNIEKNGGQNSKKEAPYLYEKNNQNNRIQDQGIFGNEPNEKTSVKVHNPPGGKSNFIFG